MSDVQLNWREIDPSTLSGDHLKRYEAYKGAYKIAADCRKAFEEGLIATFRKAGQLEASQTLAFGYRFGKLSMAIAAAKASGSAGKGAVSLAALLGQARS